MTESQGENIRASINLLWEIWLYIHLISNIEWIGTCHYGVNVKIITAKWAVVTALRQSIRLIIRMSGDSNPSGFCAFRFLSFFLHVILSSVSTKFPQGSSSLLIFQSKKMMLSCVAECAQIWKNYIKSRVIKLPHSLQLFL